LIYFPIIVVVVVAVVVTVVIHNYRSKIKRKADIQLRRRLVVCLFVAFFSSSWLDIYLYY